MEEPLEEWETSRLEVVWAESTALQSLSKRVLVLSPQSLDSRPSHVVIVSAGRGPRFPGLLIPGVGSRLTTIRLEPQAGPIAMKTVALLLVSLLTVHSQEKVQVTVFYESHCPYSVEFITQKLYPAYKALTSANMDVDLVPYGFTKYSVDDDGHYQFSCQHGPSECYGNRVQACALAELSDNLDLQVEFVNCAMSSSNSSTSGPLCASKLGIDYSPVQECVDGTTGDQLTVYNGNRTTSFSPKYAYVPWVAINGVHNNETRDTARKDLLATSCKLLNNRPEPCLKRPN
uniref:(California timema) hypothetical protein n=1 Tax=Timema californicum TaxID=61474 RepID=A0A7R9JI42_TIMCA|nr:unnamed protein product [Timema californicum]